MEVYSAHKGTVKAGYGILSERGPQYRVQGPNVSATTRQRKQSFVRRLIIPVMALSVLAYFGFHALNGELGLVGRARIEHQIGDLEKQLDVLVAQRKALVAKVSLLRPESLNPDMVDERARLNLNLVHVNELVILRPGNSYQKMN
ncbi:FtsB family cell division protein [Roseibium aggregatum]|uniref:FtsB family cell division protein n=1 Tax=Roseibium aggregatum TaxID=187304 RepID=UPI001AD8ACF3|nr:septum formation initiator family protein [Roseibium aggregatum]